MAVEVRGEVIDLLADGRVAHGAYFPLWMLRAYVLAAVQPLFAPAGPDSPILPGALLTTVVPLAAAMVRPSAQAPPSHASLLRPRRVERDHEMILV
jgi:hypothetical protein